MSVELEMQLTYLQS
jgi:hypothetical protein